MMVSQKRQGLHMSKNNYPLRHISIRVPWHDNGWNGTVCKNPCLNDSCLKLPRISEKRNENAENAVAGQSIEDLDNSQWPVCVTERAMFMSSFGYTRYTTHPYSDLGCDTHSHFDKTPLYHPPYSAPAVPFRWLRNEFKEEFAKEYDLDIDPRREPDLGFKTGWVQEINNQKALLDCFAGHIRPERSLCFFYAKRVPFVEEDYGRILIGVGRVKEVSDLVEYQYKSTGPNKIRSTLWERMITHSIRPGFQDGFILPYYEALELAQKDPNFNPEELVVFAPWDRLLEFSYVSELVTHDGAIAVLLNIAASLNKTKKYLDGPWDKFLKWINDRLGELWKLRGPCPGLGAVLSAFGLEMGTFIAREISNQIEENEDPWPLVDRIFQNPTKNLPKHLASQIDSTFREAWNILEKEQAKKNLLKLLSRFEITPEQASTIWIHSERKKNRIQCSDRDLIANPYLIYELARNTPNTVSISTIDRGVFPDSTILDKHPLTKPSALDSGTDKRRVRALTVDILERAANEGHTLRPKEQVTQAIRDLPIEPSCNVNEIIMSASEKHFEGTIDLVKLQNTECGYKLARLSRMAKKIRDVVLKRIGGKRHIVQTDWMALLNDHLKEPIKDKTEKIAREEKAAALTELAESRFSVLIGPAGTGKTTLISALFKQKDIAQGGLLLLAPTGKARVRMEQAAKGLKITAYTIAQFLSDKDRYRFESQTYCLSDRAAEHYARTVIIDESSMLTEDMLAAVFDALKGVDRFILVGDHRQLPPIGAGRPFVDIVNKLCPSNIDGLFPKVSMGYAELTIRRRQEGQDRDDLQLAEWFSGNSLEPGDDEIFEKINSSNKLKNLHLIQWDTPEEFRAKLKEVLVQKLLLEDLNDTKGFDLSLGGIESGGYTYFNQGASKKAEEWQILSPVRRLSYGVNEINRLIHNTFRFHWIEFARKKYRKIPKPMGEEQIVYGDKVINTSNHRRYRVWPKEKAEKYIANGEIGIVIGQFKTKNLRGLPWAIQIEFSTQSSVRYDFTNKDFGEEHHNYLELAYALTVHKAQGSEFGLVILVIPNRCHILSRELLYTALTRQQKQIVILHQSSWHDIKKYASDLYSDTARRLTNLFFNPNPVEINGKFYEDSLIHRTCTGVPVRSKSEVIIYDRLHAHGITPTYEQELRIDGIVKYPDFTIEDEDSGTTYYWEHCGMMYDPRYRDRWERKKSWYFENKILPWQDGGGENGTLIITKDSQVGGISSDKINELIQEVFG